AAPGDPVPRGNFPLVGRRGRMLILVCARAYPVGRRERPDGSPPVSSRNARTQNEGRIHMAATNTKCPHCGLINWQESVACKRCGAQLGAAAPSATYTAGQWASPYAPPPPTSFYPMTAFPGATAAEAGVWR